MTGDTPDAGPARSGDDERCPGCDLPGSHAVLAECRDALAARDRLDERWHGAPGDLALLGADLPTRRSLRWLRERGHEVFPLVGTPPESAGGGLGESAPDGYYARAGAVEALRRRFHCGPVSEAVVVERLAQVDGYLAVRRSCRPGTLVPRVALDGQSDPDVRAFELVEPPSGRDGASLLDDRILLQRTGEAYGDVLFAHDGWAGERVALAPDPGAVPAEVQRRLRAEMTAALL